MKHFFVITYCCLYFTSFNQIKLYGEAQGTSYNIQYYDSLERDFQNDIDSILFFFDEAVSTYNDHSIIVGINNNLINYTKDKYFLACFEAAKILYKQTNGAFDPTVYPLVNIWGFGPTATGNKLPNQVMIDSILHFVGFDKINLIENKIIKDDPRIQLDFNAFAQGYSVDVVSDYLRQKGVFNFLVEIGGEVFAQGSKWLIGIESPNYNKNEKNNILLAVKIDNKGLATSGNYRKYIEVNGTKYAHHIDPKTGKPSTNRLLSATVISDKTKIGRAHV